MTYDCPSQPPPWDESRPDRRLRAFCSVSVADVSPMMKFTLRHRLSNCMPLYATMLFWLSPTLQRTESLAKYLREVTNAL
jgi:hypothetical protein